MATIPTNIQQGINDIYNKQREAQLSQLKASQNKAVNDIRGQITQTNQDFYDRRNQADVVNMQEQKQLQEIMAANGLARSGENISGQVSLQASRQNVLGGLNRDKGNVIAGFNRQINDINDPSRQQSIISEIEAARSQAMLQALQEAIARADANARAAASRRSSRSSTTRVPTQTQSKLKEQYDAYKTLANSGRLTPEDQYYMTMEKKFPDQQKVANLSPAYTNMRRLLTIPSYAGGSTGLATAMRYGR